MAAQVYTDVIKPSSNDTACVHDIRKIVYRACILWVDTKCNGQGGEYSKWHERANTQAKLGQNLPAKPYELIKTSKTTKKKMS